MFQYNFNSLSLYHFLKSIKFRMNNALSYSNCVAETYNCPQNIYFTPAIFQTRPIQFLLIIIYIIFRFLKFSFLFRISTYYEGSKLKCDSLCQWKPAVKSNYYCWTNFTLYFFSFLCFLILLLEGFYYFVHFFGLMFFTGVFFFFFFRCVNYVIVVNGRTKITHLLGVNINSELDAFGLLGTDQL